MKHEWSALNLENARRSNSFYTVALIKLTET